MSIETLVDTGLVKRDVPLGPLTTYKSGGPSRFYAEPGDRSDLERIGRETAGSGIPILVLGRGSNLLVADGGFGGLTIRIASGFSEMEFEGLVARAGAGVPLPRLARASVDAGIAGLEFFVGVPGSVGGAIRQNAGCFGTETRDRLVVAEVVDLRTGESFTADAARLDLSYRHSNIRPDSVVVSASFAGTGPDVSKSKEELRRITRWRKDNQPGGTLNAGSVFKNPEGVSAGYLIDHAGLKGFSIGGVSVSEKHANFFVASQEATSGEIRKLIFEVAGIVAERCGVELEPEIQMVGFDDDD